MGGCALTGKIRAGVIGAASYTGGELLRILLLHSGAVVSIVTSGTFEGQSAGAAHPFLTNSTDLRFAPYDPDTIIKNCDVVFLAKPQPSSFAYVRELAGSGLKIIDLSAGFRFKDVSVFENWYGMKHECPEHLETAVYGLPELYASDISRADLVANPGCYPTGVILALAPLLKSGKIDPGNICVNAVSGFSGAGKAKAVESNFAPEIFGNIKPYKLTSHPHTPEIEDVLSRVWGKEIKVTFAPHVAGFERGILSTVYAGISGDATEKSLNRLCEEFYENNRFVRVRDESGRAEIKDVVYTNFCDIGIKVNERTGTAIITAALDNLVKGASGQAVQNMNVMFGLPEGEGMLPGGEND